MSKIRHLPWLDPEKWWVHSIDYSADEDLNPGHRGLHRAVWLHGPKSEAHAELTMFGRHRFGLGIEVGRNGGESDVGIDLHAGPIFNLYLRARAPWLKWARVREGKRDEYYARKTGIRLFPHEGTWLELKFEEREWTKGQPWWRWWHFGWRDIVGNATARTDDLEDGMTQVPMPEGVYPATWTRQVATTTYNRFPGTWRDRVLGPRLSTWVSIEIAGGIPVEGKGENSWDCGMDGLYGCSGSSVEAAVGNAVRHVLQDRKRYGGPHHLTRPMTVKEADEASRAR